jgi:prepilin-type N-terminal cleavage/methylation domain-containing protein
MRSGFSLVELSIVLVILGLLTGGILTGQNLIRAAELRAITTEFQSYQTAAMTFRSKYFALPGDMRNATDFWSAPSTGTCPTGTATGTETCNGNGDGTIIHATPGDADEFGEPFMAWQQLSNAGLIQGSYTGKAGATSNVHQIANENVPASKLSNAVWFIGSNDYTSHNGYTDGPHTNSFSIGGVDVNNITTGAILSPEETWNIDTKIDDGLPQQGSVWAIGWDTCTDAADSTVLTGEYLLSTSGALCGILFKDAL